MEKFILLLQTFNLLVLPMTLIATIVQVTLFYKVYLSSSTKTILNWGYEYTGLETMTTNPDPKDFCLTVTVINTSNIPITLIDFESCHKKTKHRILFTRMEAFKLGIKLNHSEQYAFVINREQINTWCRHDLNLKNWDIYFIDTNRKKHKFKVSKEVRNEVYKNFKQRG